MVLVKSNCQIILGIDSTVKARSHVPVKSFNAKLPHLSRCPTSDFTSAACVFAARRIAGATFCGPSIAFANRTWSSSDSSRLACSVDPIVAAEHAVTRCAVTNEKDLEKERTIGRKFTVPYGLYRIHGYINPHLAAQTTLITIDQKI